jgi:TPR repeat protein
MEAVVCMEEAVRWYQLAAGQGQRSGQRQLGVCYDHGISMDFKKAVELYRLTAGRGDAIAQCRLTVCLETGTGVL